MDQRALSERLGVETGKETLRGCFKETALDCGEGRAVTFFREDRVETVISYRELDQKANRLANTFLDLGVRKGDRVVFYLEKCLLFIAAHLAVQKIGAVSVPLNPGFKKSEMAYLLHDAEAKMVLTGEAQEAVIRDVEPGLKRMVVDTRKPFQALEFFLAAPDEIPPIEVGPDDPGLIIYTSGTTGKPKGAVLTQKNLVRDARNIIKIWEVRDSDVLCHALPLFHVHGLCFALHTALIAGSRVLLLDQFSPQRVIRMLAKKTGDHVCTAFMAVPSMYGRMMDAVAEEVFDFSHVRLWTSGSAPLLPGDFKRIKRIFGKEPVEREGMSETGMNFSNPLRLSLIHI